MKNQFVGFHLDFIGFTASMLCALHCAALPLLLTLGPLAGLQFLDNPWIEYTIIIISLIIATSSLLSSYREHHRKPLALMIAILGFVLIGLGRLEGPEWAESVLTSCGGSLIAVAHLVNWNLIKQSREPRKKVTQ
ncbi:MAG: MerC domain-containing protein [Bacteroidota bacterium]